MSDTPRTDAVRADYSEGVEAVALRQHAERLERECATLRKKALEAWQAIQIDDNKCLDILRAMAEPVPEGEEDVTLVELAEHLRMMQVHERVPEAPDLDKCPKCGGPADNGHDRCYPPNPYYCTKCNDAAMNPPPSERTD